MHFLKNKNILLIAPKFFGYETEIKKSLEAQGAWVYYADERPKNDFFTKVFLRLHIKLLTKNAIDKHYKKIFNETKEKRLDYLFVISPESIDANVVTMFKAIHPNVVVIIYMWDSIVNKKNNLLHITDKFITFDQGDKKIDAKIEFLPLFYLKEYADIASLREFSYDLSFVGTLHSDRFDFVKKIETLAKLSGLRFFSYFFSQSKLLFFWQKILDKNFKNITWNDVSFASLSRADVLGIIEKSSVVIDIQHPKQRGLTMRTIEMLGAKRKLITTNASIREYDFYNEKNICIVDRQNPKIEPNFFQSAYEEIDPTIYERYALDAWIKNIFRLGGDA